jgi:hypothetical protein
MLAVSWLHSATIKLRKFTPQVYEKKTLTHSETALYKINLRNRVISLTSEMLSLMPAAIEIIQNSKQLFSLISNRSGSNADPSSIRRKHVHYQMDHCLFLVWFGLCN